MESQNAPKYVPPMRRNQDVRVNSFENFQPDNRSGGFMNPGRGEFYGNRGPSNYNNYGGYNDGNRQFYGRNNNNYYGGQQQGSWGGGDGGGYGGHQAPYGGGGGGYPQQSFVTNNRWSESNRSYSAGNNTYEQTRVNAMGFHGDERPNPRTEARLFPTNEVNVGINFDKYDDIPIEVSEGCPAPYNEFTIETVGEQLMKNVKLCKYSKPTPVQKYSIPIGLSGGDLMACAQTGSGKTAGFLFPVIIRMLQTGAAQVPPSNRPVRRSDSFPTAIVLAPTRELASQIHEEAEKFCYCTGIRSCCVYGGANIATQITDIQRGCDIMVATPGRLNDLIERGRVRLDIVRFLVLDEADRMLDMGFEPQIRRIVMEEGMPVERQTFMFSATFPSEIQRMASDFMKDYHFLAVGRVGAASRDVIQYVEHVEQKDKTDRLIEILRQSPAGLVLIFVETRRGADTLEQVLSKENLPASSIHGDKSQYEREEALRLFRSGKTPLLVATDVAARGLDIPNVTQVINFDLPSNIEDYVHRIGRTGRVGNVGYATSMMNEKNNGIAKEMYELLSENEQQVPAFLEEMAYGHGGHKGGRGRGRGGRWGGNFGARDYRREDGGGRGRGRGGRGGGGHNRNENPPNAPSNNNHRSAPPAPPQAGSAGDAW